MRPQESNDLNVDAHLETFDKATDPQRLLRIWGKILLIIVLLVATVSITGIIWKHTQQLDAKIDQQIQHQAQATHPREWFVSKLQEIDGLKHQLKTAKAALASIEEQRKSTWISRESDRAVYNRTLDHVLALEANLAEAVKDYNSALAAANSADIAGLSSAVISD